MDEHCVMLMAGRANDRASYTLVAVPLELPNQSGMPCHVPTTGISKEPPLSPAPRPCLAIQVKIRPRPLRSAEACGRPAFAEGQGRFKYRVITRAGPSAFTKRDRAALIHAFTVKYVLYYYESLLHFYYLLRK